MTTFTVPVPGPEPPNEHMLDVFITSTGDRRPLSDLTDDEVEALVHRAVVRAYEQETK